MRFIIAICLMLIGNFAFNNNSLCEEIPIDKISKNEKVILDVNAELGNIKIKVNIGDDKYLMGGFKESKKNYKKSAYLFEKFLFSNSNALDVLVGLNFASLGMAIGSLEPAINYFENKIRENPNDPRLYYYLGILQIIGMELGENNKCSECLTLALERKLNYRKGHYIVGICYLLQGKKEAYLREVAILENMDKVLAKRLTILYDNSNFIKVYIEDKVKGKISDK